MIFFILIISLLFELDESQQIVIPQADKCQCYQIKNIDDCLADSTCTWIFQQNGTQQSCQKSQTNITQSYSLSCSSMYNSLCNQYSSGCAFVNSFCTFFLGCTAYNYTTVSQCQSVSHMCTSDGIGCINMEYSCTSYKNYFACDGSQDTFYGLSCKWMNSSCRNQDCSDAPNTFTTNTDCSRWQYNCISIGRGCGTSLQKCASYNYSKGCDGLIGTDGNCASDNKQKVCRIANCSDAPTNLTTDAQCSNYISGCISNGRGCLRNLSPCSSYSKSQICDGLKGLDGLCVDDTKGSNCKVLTCTDAPNSINTNLGCSNFLQGCFTTGYGCSSKQLSCSQFNTTMGCSNFNGTDGPCIDSTGSSICRAMTCDEAPPTIASENSCSSFKPGCISNGVRCTDKLIQCNQYNQTFVSLGCENIIGTDGNCAEDTSGTKTICRAKTCSDAPQNYQNDTICNKFRFGCITNGKGCTKIRFPCSYYNTSQGCTDYLSDQGRCGDGVNTTQCTTIECKDAPKSISTDSGCWSFWKTCLTNGKGCVTQKIPCNSYNMTDGCDGYIGSDGACYNSTDSSGKCRSAICSDALLTNYTNSVCSKFKYGCISSGIGCVSNRIACSLYNQSQGCANIIGSDGICWNDVNTTNCKPRTCTDASKEISLDYNCENFLTGCLTNGRGCVSQRSLCSQYKADADCQTYIGSDSYCFLDKTTNLCRSRVCGDFNATTDSECATFLKGCRTDGEKCLSQIVCSQFKYASLCSTDTYGQRCLWNRKLKSCFKFNSCLDVFGPTTALCQTISPYCVTNGVTCIPLDKCQNYKFQISCTNGVDGTCGWISQNNTCQLFTTQFTYKGTTIDECALWNSRYITDGVKCVAKSQCDNYETAISCGYGSYDNKTCQWNSNVRTCSYVNCNNLSLSSYDQCVKIKSSTPCTYDGTAGCMPQTNCSLYDNSFSCIQGIDGICIWTPISQSDNSTKYGCRLQQCSDFQLKTSLECTKASSKCVSNGQQCVDMAMCKYYNDYQSCSGGGIDGVCVYQSGKCKLFESCQEASQDEVACKFKSDSCYFSTDKYNVTSCNIHTCDTKARGSVCQSIPNFGLTVYQICLSNGTQCIPTQPSGLNKTNCYDMSMSTYTWDGQSCQICQDPIVNQVNGYLLIFNIILILLQRALLQSIQQILIKNQKQSSIIKTKFINFLIDYISQSRVAILIEGHSIQQYSKCNFLQIDQHLKELQIQLICIPKYENIDWQQSNQLAWNVIFTISVDHRQKFVIFGILKIKHQYLKLITMAFILFILFISLLMELDQSQQLVFPVNEQCQCQSIITIDDCLASQNCSWVIQQKESPGNCQLLANTNVTYSYSLNCANKSNIDCLKSPECALIGSFCTFFSGCSAYYYTTTASCQQISSQCVSDGEGCIDIQQNCPQYKTSYACQNSINSASGLSCKWNNEQCGNEDCLNAPDTFKTSQECSQWQPYCLNIGKGCDTVIQKCESYPISRGCDGLIGVEGKCATDTIKKKCRVATCEDAPTNLTTDAQCNSFVSGCYTFGRGCIKTKQPCSSFVKTQDCENLEGSDGECIDDNNKNSNSCKLKECSDANSSINTNQGCEEFLSGCITTGFGCSKVQLPCYQYNSQLGCINFNGTDGPCVDSFVNNKTVCRAITCDEIPPTIAENDGCESYKLGCKSNGVRCVSFLNICRGFNSTYFKLGCNQLIGSDGKCIEDTLNQGHCRPVECEDAPQTYQNDTQCNKFKEGCFTNGKGCTKSRLPCGSYNFDLGCSNFIGDLGRCGEKRGTAICTTVQCIDAPSNYSTDTDCQKFWKTCWTNGKGCVDYKQPCNQYNSSLGCFGYLDQQGPCVDSKDSSGFCRSALCEDAPYYYNQTCDKYKTGCISSGIGCVSIRQDCRNYIKSQGCSDIIGSGGQCWNQIDSDMCKTKACSDAPNITVCDKFLKGCLSDGKNCVEKRRFCSEYPGVDCEGHIGTDGLCKFDNIKLQCRAVQCQDYKGTTDDICNNQLKGCKTDGELCYDKLSCSQFLYASTCIQGQNNQKCIWNRKWKKCLNFTKCEDYLGQTNDVCQIVSPYCVSDGFKCIPKSLCKKYLNQISCVSGADGNTCGWNSQMNSCQIYKPEILYNSTSLAECKLWNQRLITDGKYCIPLTTCNYYSTQQSCSISIDNKLCRWSQGKCDYYQCEDFKYDNYQDCVVQNSTQYLCTTDGTKCIDQKPCSSYTSTKSCQQGRDGYCIWAQSLDSSGIPTHSCRIKVCQDYQLKTSEECKEAYNDCVSNGTNCIDSQNCRNYNNKESCSGGGKDGVCVFVNGACKLFEQCFEANLDEVACKQKSDSCYFIVNSKNETQCNAHTCDTKAKGSSCQPIPDFASIGFRICQMKSDECAEINPIDLNRTHCFNQSMNTYVWNGQSCKQCGPASQQPTNNGTNNTQSNGMFLMLQYYLLALL